MIRKRSSFLTFCFAFLPGAAQMYMGFMKRGASLMSAFFLLIFASTWLNLGPLMFAMPVIWFFAFFDTFNLRSLPDEEFYAMEDNFILYPELVKNKATFLHGKYRIVFALILIFIGFTVLWNNLCNMLSWALPRAVTESLYSFGRYFPQLLVGCGIVALGFYLIIGKKKDLDSMDNNKQLEDKGGLFND
jgi:hypothetical protein